MSAEGRRPLLLMLTLAMLWLCGSPSIAGSLQVSTTTLDVAAPGAATSLVLRNVGSEPTNAQIRVLKWSQKDGVETLTATGEVVASPPFAAIAPGREYTVRVVRVTKTPLREEESYRLLIDELPSAGKGSTLGVNFVVRYSIPVFFGPALRTSTAVSWRAEAGHGRLRLTAINTGSKRIRLAALNIRGPDGTNIVRQDGLVGYVLGRSSMNWTFPVPSARNLRGSASVVVTSDGGPIHAQIPLSLLP